MLKYFIPTKSIICLLHTEFFSLSPTKWEEGERLYHLVCSCTDVMLFLCLDASFWWRLFTGFSYLLKYTLGKIFWILFALILALLMYLWMSTDLQFELGVDLWVCFVCLFLFFYGLLERQEKNFTWVVGLL